MPPANQASAPTDLRVENQQLKDRIKRRNADVTKLTEELLTARSSIVNLKKALNAAKAREQEMKMETEEEEVEDEDELPEVLALDVYMCSVCTYEVVDGYCQGRGCGIQHAWPPAHDDKEVYDTALMGFTEPDGVWDSEMAYSEDEEYTLKAEDEEEQLEL